MSEILSFPGLGLEFELNPVAFEVFGWPIHWYGIIIAAGFLLAVLYGYHKVPSFGIDQDTALDVCFWTVPMAIIGARAYYVIFYLDLYINADGTFNWREAVAIWDGGLAIYGGIIMAAVTIAVCCKFYKIRFLDAMDIAAYGLLIGQLVGRWGNFVNVEAYGGLTDLPWRMCSKSIADELLYKGLLESEGAYQSILDGTLGVHPTFFYESVWNLLGFVILVFAVRKGRKFSGQVFFGYVAWYGFGRAVIEGFRTDSLYLFNTGIRVSQLVGILSCVVAVILMIILRKYAGPPPAPVPGGREKKQMETQTGREVAGDGDEPVSDHHGMLKKEEIEEDEEDGSDQN